VLLSLQVQDTLVQMVETGATGINFDLELPFKVRQQQRKQLGITTSSHCCDWLT
jgi:hypothetical protein